MKTKDLNIVMLLMLVSWVSFAQPPMYSAAEKSRENMRKSNESLNAVYEANRPNAGTSNSSYNNSSTISNSNDNYGWADYSRINRQNARPSLNQQLLDAHEAKVNKMNQLLKERNIALSKENWSKINQAGIDAGFDEYMVSRMYGNYDPSYRPDYIKDSNGNTIRNPPPPSPKSIRDIDIAKQKVFTDLIAKAKLEKNDYSRIYLLQTALNSFNDPGIEFELAKLYVQKQSFLEARTMLYKSEHNEITENKPLKREFKHIDAYIALLQSEYQYAEVRYGTIYTETETDKEIICETASANFHINNYENVYNIMKNACFNNPENKVIYSLAGAAALALDESLQESEKLFSSVSTLESNKDLKTQIAKKLYDEVQTYRKQTGKISLVTIFLLDLAVMLDPKNIDYHAERYDSNAFLGRKKETIIDEPFLK
jgi:hypothetical protein